jgi:hypothetical protein
MEVEFRLWRANKTKQVARAKRLFAVSEPWPTRAGMKVLLA